MLIKVKLGNYDNFNYDLGSKWEKNGYNKN